MKELHLIYNRVTNQYIFVSGKNIYSGTREIWNVSDFSGLLRKLKGTLNTRRKANFHLKDMPSDYIERIKHFYEKTNIGILVDSQ